MSIESSGTVNLCSLFLNQYLVLKTDMLTFSAKSAVIQKEKEKNKSSENQLDYCRGGTVMTCKR